MKLILVRVLAVALALTMPSIALAQGPKASTKTHARASAPKSATKGKAAKAPKTKAKAKTAKAPKKSLKKAAPQK
jgi:hypothetical protein